MRSRIATALVLAAPIPTLLTASLLATYTHQGSSPMDTTGERILEIAIPLVATGVAILALVVRSRGRRRLFVGLGVVASAVALAWWPLVPLLVD